MIPCQKNSQPSTSIIIIHLLKSSSRLFGLLDYQFATVFKMVRIAAVALAAVGAIAPFAAAANCKDGLNYCGYNLLAIGALPHLI